MNTLDIIILIILLMGGLNGFRLGLIKSFANLLGWIIAVIMAIKFNDVVAPFMLLSQDVVLQKIMAFIAIVMIVIALTWLLSALLNNVLQQLKLGPLNRLAGGVFGLLKSAIIVLVVMQSVSAWAMNTQAWQNSKMIEMLLPFAPKATAFAQQAAQQTWQEIRHGASEPSSQPSHMKDASQSEDVPQSPDVHESQDASAEQNRTVNPFN